MISRSASRPSLRGMSTPSRIRSGGSFLVASEPSRKLPGVTRWQFCHCEHPKDAKQSPTMHHGDCFVAALLAMTETKCRMSCSVRTRAHRPETVSRDAHFSISPEFSQIIRAQDVFLGLRGHYLCELPDVSVILLCLLCPTDRTAYRTRSGPRAPAALQQRAHRASRRGRSARSGDRRRH